VLIDHMIKVVAAAAAIIKILIEAIVKIITTA
jgi:hypothetical protein